MSWYELPSPFRGLELTPVAFNDVAEHDELWAKVSVQPVDLVEYGDDFASSKIQYLLSRGLIYLRQIVDADSYQARHQLLDSPYPVSHDNFLCEGLTYGAHGYDNPICLSDYTRKDEAK